MGQSELKLIEKDALITTDQPIINNRHGSTTDHKINEGKKNQSFYESFIETFINMIDIIVRKGREEGRERERQTIFRFENYCITFFLF